MSISKIFFRFLCVICLMSGGFLFAGAENLLPADRANLLKDGSLETWGEAGSQWAAYCGGGTACKEAHSGTRAVRIENLDGEYYGIRQKITFDPPIFEPLRFGGHAKIDAANPFAPVPGVAGDFNVYVDAYYEDGTPLWGVKANFDPEITDWQCAESVLVPAKPLKEIDFIVLFRKVSGTVTFDDFFLEVLRPELESAALTGGTFGPGSVTFFGKWNLAQTFHPEVKAELTLIGNGTEKPLPELRPLPGNRGFFQTYPEGTVPTGKQTFRLTVREKEKKLSEKTLVCDVPETGEATRYFVWTESSMNRIFPYSFPSPACGAKIGLARNEYESFQVAVLSSFADRNVKITLSELRNTADPTRKIAAENLSWRQVGSVRAEQLRPHPKDPLGAPGYWPDTLLPRKFGEFVKEQTVSFWVTVFAPEGTAPGTYAGTVTLTPEKEPAVTVPVEVRVWDFTLPRESSLPNAFALMEGPLEKIYGKPVTRELWNAYAECMLRNRLTPEGDITRTALPDIGNLKSFRGRGLGNFNLLNMVPERGTHFWVCNAPVSYYTPEVKAQTLARLKPFVEALRKEGLSSQAYVYSFDERGPEYDEVMKDFFGMIKENFPEVATFTTSKIEMDPEQMSARNVDWLCPVASVYDLGKAAKCREAGKKIWSYICCGPTFPFANIMFRYPLIEARLLGWQSCQQKYDGLLYWGVNIWFYDSANRPIDPEASLRTDFKTDWTCDRMQIYGDGILIYPGVNDTPIETIRLANLRDGFEDYEYLRLYGSVSPKVFRSPTDFTRDAGVLEAERQKMAEAIEASARGGK